MQELKKFGPPVILLLLFLASCSNEGCYEDTESNVNIFLKETDNESTLSIDSITVFGLGVQSDSLYKNASESSLSLPLFAGSAQCVFIIINGTTYDTIKINYTSRYNFVSKGCGYNYLHNIESVSFTKNKIDTILIISNSVTPSDEENLRTFF
jgi:hypothetical protein